MDDPLMLFECSINIHFMQIDEAAEAAAQAAEGLAACELGPRDYGSKDDVREESMVEPRQTSNGQSSDGGLWADLKSRLWVLLLDGAIVATMVAAIVMMFVHVTKSQSALAAFFQRLVYLGTRQTKGCWWKS